MNDALWAIVILLVIIVFQLIDIGGKVKRCGNLLADCANSLDEIAPDSNDES